MSRKKRLLHNDHHLIARGRAREGYNVGHRDNIARMPVKEHDYLHRYHGIRTPQEQMLADLLLNEPTINEGIANTLYDILTLDKHEFYKKHLLLGKKHQTTSSKK